MAIDYEGLGKRIKAARKSKGYTQEQLAAATGMSQQHIGNIETAANKLSLQALVDIANALDVSIDTLLFESLEITKSDSDLQMQEILSGCTEQEKAILVDLLSRIRSAIDNKNV